MLLNSFKTEKVTIDSKEFIELYSKEYFLSEEGEDKEYTIKAINRSRNWIEEDMIDLLKKGWEEWTEADVVHMLAWKMGRIDHKKSTNGVYKFTGNGSWSDKKGDLKANNRTGEIKIDSLAKNIIDFKKDYSQNKEEYDTNPEALLERLRRVLDIEGQEEKITGIGSVYLITILYFVSGGIYPIYDQFAMKALEALEVGAVPGDNITLKALPDKNEKAFINSLTKSESGRKDPVYRRYIDLLVKLFNEEENSFRNINYWRKVDQALWVYGHRFN